MVIRRIEKCVCIPIEVYIRILGSVFKNKVEERFSQRY